MGKKHVAVLLAVLCVFAGCGKTGNDAPALNDLSGDSRESIYFNSYNKVVSSPDGYYTLQRDMGSEDSGSYLTYIGKESGKETYLCSKPDCRHVDDSVFHYILESCDAYVGCAMLSSLQWYNDSVYLLEYDKETYDVTLAKVSGDGSVHERLMKVGQAPGFGAYYKYVFADEETIYMTYDDPETFGEDRTVSLRKIDLKTKEITDVYTCSGSSVSISYGMMVLNRNLFFRQVTRDEDGVYQERLMRYDMDTGEAVVMIDGNICSYTLVGNGRLVYAVPKDGLYLYEMQTGKSEKIRQCDDETMYVTLAWDGTYLYLDNLENSVFYDEEGERKLFVCTLDGETVNELAASANYVSLCDGDYIIMEMFVQGEGVFWSYMKSSDITDPNAEWTVLRPE